MELGVVMTHQNFGFHVLLRVLFVMSGQWRTEVDTSAGALSEAKTQRRPHSARESERGGFLCCFVVFVSLSRARIDTEGKTTRRSGEKGEALRWCKRATA